MDLAAVEIFPGVEQATNARPRACLTARQLQVLELAAAGMTSAQMARELTLSVAVIDFHLMQARRRLRAASTTQAVAIAVREGWI